MEIKKYSWNPQKNRCNPFLTGEIDVFVKKSKNFLKSTGHNHKEVLVY